MESTCAKQWEAAVNAELEQLKASGTFEWVEKLPDSHKAIGSKIVFRTK